jgi:hypothetical protein
MKTSAALARTTRQDIERLLLDRPNLTMREICAALPKAKQRTIEWALWGLVRSLAVVRTPGGVPRHGVEYRYALALGDDDWSPQPWQHPYARPMAEARA